MIANKDFDNCNNAIINNYLNYILTGAKDSNFNTISSIVKDVFQFPLSPLLIRDKSSTQGNQSSILHKKP